MDGRLILGLSLVGVAMAFAGVFGLTGNAEPIIWLFIFAVYAIVIAKRAPGNFFLHAFLTSLLNGLWIAVIHSAFFDAYIAHNPAMMEQYNRMPHPLPPRAMMFVMGPVIGAVTGLVAGLMAIFAGMIFKKNRAA